ncbi:unnamed protein product [Spirodela intermedia]|uniref:LIM zinc-binding domain-containing protein n=1 Tax=Spirodela intermedia TaxID=51605 RepID=A0A7I8IIM1_SPIIN|nr:unnamed protein product [Spirodela intermedia]CAA6657714.1 unnamed protein product [Spirodela intermedia]
MGWLKRIFKGSSHKISHGKYHISSGGDEVSDGSFSFFINSESFSDPENEDIAQAIALSLSEEQKKAKAIGNFARSLNVKSPPHESENTYQPFSYLFPSDYRVCAGCNAEIGRGRFLGCMGATWHPECFCCRGCNQPISDYEFSMFGNYPITVIAQEQYHPKCDVCKHFIPTNYTGLIEYRAHPFWHQKYCPSHELDGTPRCYSCERMEPRTQTTSPWTTAESSALNASTLQSWTTASASPLFLDIQEFYEGLNMKVTQQIPLLLVERQALNEAMEGEKTGHHHLPETRGLCLSEEQTVSTILRRPRIDSGNRAMDMIIEPYRLTRVCEVTAILILYGLPRFLTGSILAHEMMHAWLRLNGYRNLSQEVEEGICQVLAHMWLDSEVVAGRGAMHQIESDASSAYGDGFRAGNQAVHQYGLRRTLDHIKLTGMFP